MTKLFVLWTNVAISLSETEKSHSMAKAAPGPSPEDSVKTWQMWISNKSKIKPSDFRRKINAKRPNKHHIKACTLKSQINILYTQALNKHTSIYLFLFIKKVQKLNSPKDRNNLMYAECISLICVKGASGEDSCQPDLQPPTASVMWPNCLSCWKWCSHWGGNWKSILVITEHNSLFSRARAQIYLWAVAAQTRIPLCVKIKLDRRKIKGWEKAMAGGAAPLAPFYQSLPSNFNMDHGWASMSDVINLTETIVYIEDELEYMCGSIFCITLRQHLTPGILIHKYRHTK